MTIHPRCGTWRARLLVAGLLAPGLACACTGAPGRAGNTAAAAPGVPGTSVPERAAVAPRTATVQACPAADVHAVAVAAISGAQARSDTLPERLALLPASAPGARVRTVVAVGPILGSMDSRSVATSVACTSVGVAVTGTVTRSAEFHGGVHKNVLWRPNLTVTLEPRRPDAVLQVVWRMRLSTGAELFRAQTPPFPEQSYPRTLTVIVGAHGGP